MPPAAAPTLRAILSKDQNELLAEWLQAQLSASTVRAHLMRETELREQSREFLTLLQRAVAAGAAETFEGPEWASMREFLAAASRSRAQEGFTATETAIFVLSLKRPLFERLRGDIGSDARLLADALWHITAILDRAALYVTETFLNARESVIQSQQRELLELSTPVVELWHSIVALPLIGTLDSERTQVVMESLLQKIVETGATIAIIDITGVPTVDTLVAQYLLKTVAAARLMGADCFISGIRPQIAQTIVHLGVDLRDVTTKATLADAFMLALRRTQAKLPQAAGNS